MSGCGIPGPAGAAGAAGPAGPPGPPGPSLNCIDLDYDPTDYAGAWTPNPGGFRQAYWINGNVMFMTFNLSGGLYVGPCGVWYVKIPAGKKPKYLGGFLTQGGTVCNLIADGMMGTSGYVNAQQDPIGDGNHYLAIIVLHGAAPTVTISVYGQIIFEIE